jgi:hypothetical protein
LGRRVFIVRSVDWDAWLGFRTLRAFTRHGAATVAAIVISGILHGGSALFLDPHGRAAPVVRYIEEAVTVFAVGALGLFFVGHLAASLWRDFWREKPWQGDDE